MHADGNGHDKPKMEIARGKADANGNAFGYGVDEHRDKKKNAFLGNPFGEIIFFQVMVLDETRGPPEKGRAQQESQDDLIRGQREFDFKRNAFLGQGKYSGREHHSRGKSQRKRAHQSGIILNEMDRNSP